MRKVDREYLRSSIFGLEDALVSTTGAIVGLSAATVDTKFVLLAGVIIVTVEAIAMGVGQFLSEETLYEAEGKKIVEASAMASAAVMLVSYFFAGLIPLVPLVLLPYPASIIVSVILAFVGLFTIGYVKGRIVNIPPVKSALKMMILGGIATIVGVIVGLVLKR